MERQCRTRLYCALVAFGLLGCETQPLTVRPALPEEVQLKQTSRVIQCQAEGDTGADVVAYKLYAIDAMTTTLNSYPSLAAVAGIDSVDTCEEASVFTRAYDEYSESHPGFEDHPDPLWTADPATSASASQRTSPVPRKFISNGTRDTYYSWEDHKPSPIVGLTTVYWLANHSSDAFYIREAGQNIRVNEFCEPIWSCSATFINKHNLLTDAHCMQNTRRLSVSKNPPRASGVWPYCQEGGQPTNPKTYSEPGQNPPGQYIKKLGLSSWLIFWPSQLDPKQREVAQSKEPVRPPELPIPYNTGSYPYNTEYEYTYLPMKMIGVTAYQHPHPGYKGQLDTADPTDIAILSLDPSSGVDAYLPPDIIREGGLAYIKASTGSNPDRSENNSFYIAGYGKVPEDSGLKVDQLNVTKAPADLKWKYGILDIIAWGTIHYSDAGRGSACQGDSGGPLYKNAAAPGKIPKIVQYGLTSFGWGRKGSDGCLEEGGTQAFLRLEWGNEMINWINETLGKPVFVQKDGTPKTIAKCKRTTIADAVDPTASEVYRCWGEPCGGPAPLVCPQNQVCVGSALDLPITAQCRVCGDGTCNCILGQCMEVAPK